MMSVDSSTESALNEANNDLDNSKSRLGELRALARYEDLGKPLRKHEGHMSFNNLVVMLDLEKEYAEFVSSSDGKFKDVAESAPALVNGIIYFKAGDRVQKAHDYAISNWFYKAYDRIVRTTMSSKAARSNCAYMYSNQPDSAIPHAELQPSGVFYYRRHGRSLESIHLVVEAMLAPGTGLLPNVVLGKLADYVRIIWSHQPTRKFVPVLLLRGIHMTMVIFTRGKYHCVELGEFMLNAPSPAFDQLDYIADTFQRLWFILMQPSNRFGYIVDISADFRYWRFGGKASKATVELSTFKDNLAVVLGERIDQRLHVLGRVAHVIRVKCRGASALLKLAWIPTDQLPEGVVYDVLAHHKVTNVPMIHSSGILVEEFFGYRLDYVLMEDCGETISSYFAKHAGAASVSERVSSEFVSVVGQCIACLVDADDAGVLHQDISPSNIVVQNGRTCIIDWGLANIQRTSSTLVSAIAAKWDIDLDRARSCKPTRGQMTGTPLFMSIRVLLGHPTRGIVDDIESLFYAILYALSYLSDGPDKCLGFSIPNNSLAGATKLGLVAGKKSYLQMFGVYKYTDEMQRRISILYNTLFRYGGKSIACELVDDEDDPRELDVRFLYRTLGPELFDHVCDKSAAGSDDSRTNGAPNTPSSATPKRKESRASHGHSSSTANAKKTKPARSNSACAPNAAKHELRLRSPIKYTR